MHKVNPQTVNPKEQQEQGSAKFSSAPSQHPFHLGSMEPHSLCRPLVQLLPVQLGTPGTILLLGVLHQCQDGRRTSPHLGRTVLAPEESVGPGITSQLHLSQLLPSPVGV